MTTRSVFALATASVLATAVTAQFRPGLDVSISDMGDVLNVGYDAAAQAVAISSRTTSCNVGSVVGDWYAAMDPRHPLICNMMCRLHDDRFVQISNYAYVKHSFASTNSNACGTCQSPGSGSLLGLNCSDTYGASLNASRTYLGPAHEIDPFNGEWKPVGSYFDRGEPDVGAPFNRDGVRSPINVTSPLGNRCIVSNDELLAPGARFFAQGSYIVQWELEANRENNMGSHEFTAVFTGANWNIDEIDPMLPGNVLQRWPGARVESAANYVGATAMDGRFYVASKVARTGDGWWHYEYAVMNRDNHGAGAQFRVPLAAGAPVRAIGFHDIDDDAGNEWLATVTSGEIVYDSVEGNIHRWHSIYNFWFESTAGPVNGAVTVTQASVRAGANATVSIDQDVPLSLTSSFLGDGCGASSPRLYTNRPATIPNPNVGVEMTGAAHGANVALHLGFAGIQMAVFGCTVSVDPVFAVPATADGAGTTSWTLAIPNDVSLDGTSVFLQGAEAEVGGPLLQVGDLSNGVEMRIGTAP